MKEFASEIPYFDVITYVEFSAETGEGVDEIREIIEEIASLEPVEHDYEAEDEELFDDPEEPIIDENSGYDDEPFSGFLTPRRKK
ncbi:MAG: YihA family ribosome biogenesis GTP-binding protein, partial [Oscillospiraceae bacterium]